MILKRSIAKFATGVALTSALLDGAPFPQSVVGAGLAEGPFATDRFSERSDSSFEGSSNEPTRSAALAAKRAYESSELLPAKKQEIDKLFTRWNSPTSPGCAVAVLLEGNLVYEGFFGSANLEDRIPIQAETVFNACSMANEFTALAIHLLVTRNTFKRDVAHSAPDYGESLVVDTMEFLRDGSGKVIGFLINNQRILGLMGCWICCLSSYPREASVIGHLIAFVNSPGCFSSNQGF